MKTCHLKVAGDIHLEGLLCYMLPCLIMLKELKERRVGLYPFCDSTSIIYDITHYSKTTNTYNQTK